MQKATLATFGITYERVDFTPILCLCARFHGATRRSGSSPVPRNELAEQKIAIGCESRPGSQRPARAAALPFAVAVSAFGSSGRDVPGSTSGAQVPERDRALCPPAAVLLALARNGRGLNQTPSVPCSLPAAVPSPLF